MCIIYSERISVSQGIQHGKRMYCFILSSVACLVLPHFPHDPINGTTFENNLLNIKHVFGFSQYRFSETLF